MRFSLLVLIAIFGFMIWDSQQEKSLTSTLASYKCTNKVETPQPPGKLQTPITLLEHQADILPDKCITRYCTNDSVLYLTFDDGPSNLTSAFIQTLKAEDTEATLFLVGQQVAKHKNELSMYKSTLFRLGNHTLGHERLKPANYNFGISSCEEVARANHLVIDCFRAPWGDIDTSMINWVYDTYNEKTYHWSIDSWDWYYSKYQDGADSIVNQVTSALHPGAIILMHDRTSQTLQAVRTLIPKLKKQGWKFKKLPI